MRTRRREQKVRQIALDVLFLATNLDPLAAGADEVFQRGIQIHLMAHLVKVRHLQIAAQAHRAAVGGQFAQNHLQQRRLASAIRTQQTYLVATQNGAAELLNNILFAKRLADICQLGHDLALIAVALAGSDIHIHTAQHITALRTAGPQFLQSGNTALAASAAGFHAFANPDFFLGQQLVGLGVDDRLLCQLLFLLQHVLREVARIGAQNAPVQLHNACGNAVQKAAVVGNGDDAALEGNQQLLQPLNRVQVQVVGRLIQQQHVRTGHQRLSQCHALAGAARQAAYQSGGVQVQALQRLFYPLLPVPGVISLNLGLQRIQVFALAASQIALANCNHFSQTIGSRLKNRVLRIQVRLLSHISNTNLVLNLKLTVIRFGQAAQNLEQRRLASAIAADQTDAFAGFQGEIGVVQQGHVPERQLSVQQSNQCHRVRIIYVLP